MDCLGQRLGFSEAPGESKALAEATGSGASDYPRFGCKSKLGPDPLICGHRLYPVGRGITGRSPALRWGRRATPLNKIAVDQRTRCDLTPVFFEGVYVPRICSGVNQSEGVRVKSSVRQAVCGRRDAPAGARFSRSARFVLARRCERI